MSDEEARQGKVTAAAMANVRTLRERHRMSAKDLSDRLPPELGLTRAILANLETARRDRLSVDELAALAEVFGMEPWDLVRPLPPACDVCNDCPPAGFRCMGCGKEGKR